MHDLVWFTTLHHMLAAELTYCYISVLLFSPIVVYVPSSNQKYIGPCLITWDR